MEMRHIFAYNIQRPLNNKPISVVWRHIIDLHFKNKPHVNCNEFISKHTNQIYILKTES